jgi:integrase/recombinase XerD
MFETLYLTKQVRCLHRAAPFAAERERYLEHCSLNGSTITTLRQKGRMLLWVARRMDAGDRDGVDHVRLMQIVNAYDSRPTLSAIENRVNVARPWLRYLGWWRAPNHEIPFRKQFDRFVSWMQDERGFSPLTVRQWSIRTAEFLRWCGQTDRTLATLRPDDIDEYFVKLGAGGWNRVSLSSVASALCVFLRHAATSGACDHRLPATIRGPRRYAQESLPWAPSWPDVQRLIA